MTVSFIFALSLVATLVTTLQVLNSIQRKKLIEKAKQEEPQLETLKSPQDWYAEGKIEFISELERIIWDQLNNGMNGEVPIPDPYAAEDELRTRRARKNPHFTQITDGVEWDGEAERIDYGWGSVVYHTHSGKYEVEGKRFKSLSEAKIYGEKLYESRLDKPVLIPKIPDYINLTKNELIKRALELGAPKDKILKMNKAELIGEVFERKSKTRCGLCDQEVQYYGVHGKSGPKLAVCHTCAQTREILNQKIIGETTIKKIIDQASENG